MCAGQTWGMPSGLRALKTFGVESDTLGFELPVLSVSYSDQEVTCRRFLNYNRGMLMPHTYLFLGDEDYTLVPLWVRQN